MNNELQDNKSAGKRVPLPLSGIRVLDMCDARGQGCGRVLADLGADVVLIEPPTGMCSRQRQPVCNGESVYFASHNANKRSVSFDFSKADDRQHFESLVISADLLIDGTEKGYWEAIDYSHAVLRRLHPTLLILSITDFGLSGPYKDFVGSESVHMAMGTMLARSGRAGREPLLPPGEVALEIASVQAAWVALLAYWQRQYVGRGDLLDFSINDAVAQLLDPAVGATGSAAAGRTFIEAATRGRPEVEFRPGKLPSVALMYPVFQCVDGAVRICVLNPRQWRAMSDWLGAEHPFRDRKYEKSAARLMQIDRINGLIAKLFADKTREQLVAEGSQRGVPIASLAKPSELFDDHHFLAREFFAEVDVGGETGRIPSGFFCIDQRRVGIRCPAPKLGQDAAEVLSGDKPLGRVFGSESPERRPFAGLRVLDLGVIVAGGELGRLFADQGADVIKLENREYGDGLRQSFDGNPVSIPFTQASRGKRSLGLNLRSEKGLVLFRQLVAQSDIVLSNFKPGTTGSLGIDYASLKAVNPRIICAESSAMGSTGPKAQTMGYGPLVRASTSLTGLWRYPDQEDGYGDGVTIYPDHFVARVSAVAVLAKLIERERTGKGGLVDLSQAECIMTVLATEFLRESLQPGTMVAKGNRYEFDAPNTLFKCRGEDEWSAISVSTDKHWAGLARALGRQDLAENPEYATATGRLRHRDKLEAAVAAWCADKSPRQVRDQLQAEGVPAGNMLRLSEFIGEPHYQSRHFFRTIHQPTAGRPMATENAPVGFSETLPEPAIRSAPARGQHSTEILQQLLALSDEDIAALIASGDIEQGFSADKGARSQKYKTMAVNLVLTITLWISRLRAW